MNRQVYGLGDMYAPAATLSQAQGYQNVRRRIYARIDSVLS